MEIFWIFGAFSFEDLLEEFLGGFFWEDFFGRNFLGGIFWEKYFGRIFWEVWEDFFGRNSLFCLSAKLLAIDLFVKILDFFKILSESRRKE